MLRESVQAHFLRKRLWYLRNHEIGQKAAQQV